jgi:hypothetical protein
VGIQFGQNINSNQSSSGTYTGVPLSQTTTFTIFAGTFYQGCTSFSGYSNVDGQPCITGAQTATVTILVENTNYPAGCTSPLGYSPTTGMMCTFPTVTWMPGCTSAQGFNNITGQSCNWTTVYPGLPQGCSSTSGFSVTTGQLCINGRAENPTVTTPTGIEIPAVKKTQKIGSRGDLVKIIQKFLGITADGVYGKGTASKVKQWQVQNGLKADGAFGSQSWTKINSGN